MEIKRWAGIRNTFADERLKPNELTVALNLDIDNAGRLLSRVGHTVINATSSHSLFATDQIALVMQGATLKVIEADNSLTTIATLTNSNPVAFHAYAGVVYGTNGVDTFRLVGRSYRQWGVTPPVGQPHAEATTGDLPPGRYLYAMTFRRSDGHESGTGVAGYIDLPTGGGIAFSQLEVSTNTEVHDKILYVSSPNGEALRRARVVANSATVAEYRGYTELGAELTTQFAGPPPPGTLVRGFNGHLMLVDGDTIYFSRPHSLELFDLDNDYLRFPGQVAVFEPVNDGMFVATSDVLGDDPNTVGATWYLSGNRPDQLKSTQLFDYGAVPGTAVRTQAAYFETNLEGESRGENAGSAVVWTTRHGVCVGFDGGTARNLTETKYSFPDAQRGVGLVRQSRGYVQYIVVVRGAGAANNEF